ncbi:hypothetical protein K504DRAFT_464009 [Pleomassaria siparia CBS 279.74]|uniref:ATP-dependent DNA ligase family profile domain-containing protein n=1 Tax=Pleomassaria siparia CBS 279.74 TaxID=1314801 RepID=A0A6G1JRG9_9PLEO|nr:hypothetical protein K504DRAFT_464009 [Pleomassaria siparia CBS 279.74]
MALAFNDVCALLNQVEKISTRTPRLPPEESKSQVQQIIYKWFSKHRQAINDPNANGDAFLSALFPHRRRDRVYGLQPKSLSRKLISLLDFNHGSRALFNGWTTGHKGDLGVYTALAMKPWDGTMAKRCPILIERVDRLLTQLAAQYRFSDPAIRKKRDLDVKTDTELKDIFIRLESMEAKWLVRLLLRQYCTIEWDEQFVLGQYHFLLPDLLNFQNNFHAASSLLKGELSCYPPNPEHVLRKSMRIEAASKLAATVGVKVGRPTFYKAWSFKNCFQLVGNRAWAAEVKYDGEYCEIHIDLENSSNSIQIFSKNGKDATADRESLHGTIRDSLRVGHSDCRFKSRCIVLGEMVLYSDQEKNILPFSKIRKHVARSGSFMGTFQDSLPHEWEHLMVVFFDILVLDDDAVLRHGLQERRRILKDVVQVIPGRSMRSEWTLIDFKTEDGCIDLKQVFARTLADRQEGMILKPLHAPYFPLLSEIGQGQQPGYFIKVKKDYLGDMGGERDLGDFAIVGASFDPQVAGKTDLKNLYWTHFHMGCLTNKSAVEQAGAKPEFKIVGALSLDKCIPKPELKYLNDHGYLQRTSIREDGSTDKFNFKHSYGYDRRMSIAFKEPFVAEILGSGYEQAQNETFEILRHPRIRRLHHDRAWQDTVTMEELEHMSGEKWEVPNADELNGHAKDVALLAEKYLREKTHSQVTVSEHDTTQEMTQRTTPYSSPSKTQELAPASIGSAAIQESLQLGSPQSWATISSTQFTGSTQGVGIKASNQLRAVLGREDTSERRATSPPTPAPPPFLYIPTPATIAAFPPTLISSAGDDAHATAKRRRAMLDTMISPPMSKRRNPRTPLKDAGTSRNSRVSDFDSQEKTIHIHAEE